MHSGSGNPRSKLEAETILIERVFDAPRELVFEAWTNPEHLLAWFAPRGCTVSYSHIDVRPGGRFLSRVQNPSFSDCWCVGEYLEVVAPERIVYSIAIADSKGNKVDPAHAGHHPDWPRETIVRVTLEDDHGSTRLTLEQNASTALAKQTGAYPSWLQMLDELDRFLIVRRPHAK
jgi:uncharacterized protein YndB with AHSA1/START domain